jgi:acetyltransferase-like isoleucine patch superfamily enzyme
MVFKKMGRRTRILRPLKIEGYQNIILGNKVVISKYTWLAAVPLTGDSVQLEIQDGAVIGNFNHIYATQKIVIERKVLTADKVYISDNLHHFDKVDMAILDQPIKQLLPVIIGEGSWIGENVCIIGASIGKNCVIGANSVVNKNIPDYSVAVGSPAKVIKRFCFTDHVWKKVDLLGDFIDN